MGVEKEAGVHVKLTGDEEVAAATKKMSNAWGEVGQKAGDAFKAAGGAIGNAVQGVLSDIGHVVSAAGAISFAGSVASVERFEDSVARLGVASGRSIGSVQSGINELAQEIGEMPQVTEQWVHAVGDLTYSYERAAASAKGLQEFALQTGQSIQSVTPLAATLDQIGAGGDKAGHALAVMTKQAEMLGTVGGPKALGDMLVRLQGQITELAPATAKTTALLAGFGGKEGFTAQQRERGMGSVLSRIEGNTEGFERFMGLKVGSLSDEFGHLKDPSKVIGELQKYAKKGRGQQFRVEQAFGREATAMIMRTDMAGIREAERALESGAGGHALQRFKDTPAGVKHDQEIRKDIAMQKSVGSDSLLGGIRRQVGEWAADNPLLTGGGLVVAGTLAKGAVGAGMKALGFGGGAGGAAGAAGAGAVEAGGAGTLLTGGGATALGAFGLVGAGMLAQVKTLTELGAASAAKQGYSNRVIGADEAAALSARAQKAKEEAYAKMSPGQRQAMAMEEMRKGRETVDRAAAGGGAPGVGSKASQVDPKMAAMVEQLVKAGATLQLAQETAKQMLAAGGQPIQIEIFNPTGADIDAQVRGRQ